MPNVLFLVHTEEMFRQWFPDKLYTHRLFRSAKAKKYDRVIVLDSGLEEAGPSGDRGTIHELTNLDLETWDWSWGYEPEMFEHDDPEEADWVIDAYFSTHDWTWVPYELRDERLYFQHAKVFVGGGGDNECLGDWESVLDYMGIEFERIEGLIF